MPTHRPTLFTALRHILSRCGCVVLTQVVIGQEPPAEAPDARSPRALRLVYELPVDALQRTLQHDTERSMEELIGGAVATITARLGADAEVARDGAAGFAVEFAAATPDAVADVRRRVEMIGKLEFRLLASTSYEPVDLRLEEERQRLAGWLAQGGLQKLREDPSSLAQFTPAHPENLGWFIRRVDPKNKASNYLISNVDAGRAATVTTFTPEQWRTPPANAGHMLEVVAINRHVASFSATDMDADRTKLVKGRATTVIQYFLKAGRRQAYEDWCVAHAGQCCAVVLDGEVVVAPIVQARTAGRGMIAGHFDEQQANDLTMALQTGPLPARPKLVRQEPLSSPAKTAPGEAGK